MLILSDKQMGRQGGIKKAEGMLKEVLRRQNQKYVEVYERIVYELRKMSNYYYIKIRDGQI